MHLAGRADENYERCRQDNWCSAKIELQYFLNKMGSASGVHAYRERQKERNH
jgi:hypothetical protein